MKCLGGPIRLVLPVVAGLLLLAGCAEKAVVPSTRADVTAAPPSSWVDQETTDRARSAKHAKVEHKKARTAGATPSAPTPPWAQLVDQETGIRFALPQAVAPRTTRLQGGGTGRTYQAQTSDGIQFAVGLTPASAGGDLAAMRAKLDELVEGLHHVGATGVHAEHVQTLSVDGYPALDAGVAFVGRNDDQRSVWKIRCVLAGATTVMMQTITFADPGDRTTQARVAALHQRLTRSLQE